MHRFFIEEENVIDDDKLTLTSENYNHAKNVLRIDLGEKIEVVYQGRVYVCQVEKISKKTISCRVNYMVESSNESNIDIYLYQGIPKGKKMDLIIQKMTELGVKKIYPLKTQRTIVKLDKKAESKKIDRWNQISIEASKQCKRDVPLKVEKVKEIEDLDDIKGTLLVAYEEESSKGIKEVLRSSNISGPIHLIIGPEGGLTSEEVSSIKSLGGKSVKLGPRILRTETASIVASSIILYELGDLGVI